MSIFLPCVWAQKHNNGGLDFTRDEARIHERYAGWTCDQFVGLIRQIFVEIEGNSVELVLHESPMDLDDFMED